MRRYLLQNLVPLTVLGLSLGLPLPNQGRILNIPGFCPFHNLTGIPCPGCGLTRSFVSLGHGHFQEAFLFHPAGPVLFTALIAYLILSLPFFDISKLRRYYLHFGAAGFSMLTAVWSVRLAGWFPWP